MRRKNSGVTLIALIITIIVLLILAGVTIAMVVGDNGILNRATEAADKSSLEDARERIQLEVIGSYDNLGNLDMDKLKENLEKNLGIDTGEVGDRLPTGTITLDGNEFYIDENENVLEIDKTWVQEGDVVRNTETGLEIEVGDYINYDATPIVENPVTTVVSYSENTGIEEDQTFDLNTDLKWRILGVKNGQIQIISEKPIGPDERISPYDFYALYGVTGLRNAEKEIEEISSMYGQGEYASYGRALTHEDIVKSIGLTPEYWNEAEGYGKDTLALYGNEITYYWNGNERPYYESTLFGNGSLTGNYSEGFYWYDYETEEWNHKEYNVGASEENKEEIVTLKSDFYGCIGSDLLDENGKIYEMIFEDGTGNPAYYWLGSRYVFANSDYAIFGVYVVRDGLVGNFYLARSDGSEADDGLRCSSPSFSTV